MAAIKYEQVGGRAVAEDGLVLLDGPDGVAVAMTAEAARGTAHELLAAADEAEKQEGPADDTGTDAG